MREIDREVDLAQKMQNDEKRLNDLKEAVSKLKLEYDNVEDALCHKKDKFFMDEFTTKMEENGLERLDKEVSHTGLSTYFKHKEYILIMTLFPKQGRMRKLFIGLNSRVDFSSNYYEGKKYDQQNTAEFGVCYIVDYTKKYHDDYSSEKTEDYYKKQIQQLNEDIKFIKTLNVETGIKVYIANENQSPAKILYAEISCSNAVDCICNEVDIRISK
jgi:hypothetical protein